MENEWTRSAKLATPLFIKIVFHNYYKKHLKKIDVFLSSIIYEGTHLEKSTAVCTLIKKRDTKSYLSLLIKRNNDNK